MGYILSLESYVTASFGRLLLPARKDILDRQEYIGDTVNFRTARKSFKDHTKVHFPKEHMKRLS